MSHETLITLHS